MAKKRKTRAEIDQQSRLEQTKVWDEFLPRLSPVQTLDEAKQLCTEMPPLDAPGRKCYTNLKFFLEYLAVPAGSNGTERQLYISFVKRLVAADSIKPEFAEKAIADLRSSLAEQP